MKMNPQNFSSLPKAFLKRLLWLGVLAMVLWLAQVGTTIQAAPLQSTIPPTPANLVVLVGPVDDNSTDTWVVAGIAVDVSNARLNERMGAASQKGWARVEGLADGNGGLIAYRVKMLPQQPFVRLQGQLQQLTVDALQVGGIPLARSVTTLLAGNPALGDRVHVAAAIDSAGSLLALRVHRAGNAHEDDEDDDAEESSLELIGVVQERPTGSTAIGTWKISGIVVTVNDATEIKERVGPLLVGAWVKVEGNNDGNGGILAQEMRSVRTQSRHKLEGTLHSLNSTVVGVDGVLIALNSATQIKGSPTVNAPVEVEAQLQPDGSLLATVVKGKKGDGDDEDGDGLVRLKGVVRVLPPGNLGEWKVDQHTVLVTEATLIDEHKALVEVGAMVRIRAQRDNDGTFTAVEIVVVKGNSDDDDDKPGNRFVKFEGSVKGLPSNGLKGDWTVNDVTVQVDERTRIKGHVSSIAIGIAVEVKGFQRTDGVVEAREIKVEAGDDDEPDEKVEFTGQVEQLPGGNLVGEWRVAGRVVYVGQETKIEKRGQIQVGSTVEVKGTGAANGNVHAEEIKPKK